MQRNDQAEKKKALIDGEELPGLVFVGEVSREKGQIEVPGYNRTRRIQNGVTTIPPVEMRYKLQKDTNTRQFLLDWYDLNEEHDVTVITTDVTGSEIERQLMQMSECVQHTRPEYAGESPVYSMTTIIIVPWDIITIDPEV